MTAQYWSFFSLEPLCKPTPSTSFLWWWLGAKTKEQISAALSIKVEGEFRIKRQGGQRILSTIDEWGHGNASGL
jgi:hypothetical protein